MAARPPYQAGMIDYSPINRWKQFKACLPTGFLATVLIALGFILGRCTGPHPKDMVNAAELAASILRETADSAGIKSANK